MLENFVGRSDSSFFQYVIDNLSDKYELDYLLNQKNSIFEKIISELQPINGFPEFIELVIQNNIKRAIVTSSSKATMEMVGAVFPFRNYFDILICEEDTDKHKPYPDPYLLGLERTNSEKSTTLVIEDSINGIKSGKAAGCIVFGITTSLPREVLIEAGADLVLDSYPEILKHISF